MTRPAAALTSLCLLVDVGWLARLAKLGANTFAWGSDHGPEVIARPSLGALAVELSESSPALLLGVSLALTLTWIDVLRWGGPTPGPWLGASLAFALAATCLTLGPLLWMAPELHTIWTPTSWARTDTVAASAGLSAFVLLAIERPTATTVVIALPAPALAWMTEQLSVHHFNCFHHERIYPTVSHLWGVALCAVPVLIALAPLALRRRCLRGASRRERPPRPGPAARAGDRAASCAETER